MKLKIIASTAVLFSTFIACQDDGENLRALDDSLIRMDLPVANNAAGRIATNENVTIFSAEYLTMGESGEVGRTIIFNNVGNKQLSADFVPGVSLDNSDNISYYIDENRPTTDAPVTVSTNAIV